MSVKILHGAFDIGTAALNSAQDRWAAYVRPMFAGVQSIAVGRMGQGSTDVQTLPVPDGIRPGRIAWSGEKVIILAKNGEQDVCFVTEPGAGTPEWKSVGVHTFPGLPDFMLNKSESLEIAQVTQGGKPCVEVARVWFTNDIPQERQVYLGCIT